MKLVRMRTSLVITATGRKLRQTVLIFEINTETLISNPELTDSATLTFPGVKQQRLPRPGREENVCLKSLLITAL